MLLTSLLRTLWRLSYQDMHDWLQSWPALALACGLPLNKQGQFRIPSKSQQCKRRHAAGAPLYESLFVLTVLHAIQSRLIGARDLIIDSAPILAWRRYDPDAAFGHAPAHHPRPLLRGFRVHTLICRGSHGMRNEAGRGDEVCLMSGDASLDLSCDRLDRFSKVGYCMST